MANINGLAGYFTALEGHGFLVVKFDLKNPTGDESYNIKINYIETNGKYFELF